MRNLITILILAVSTLASVQGADSWRVVYNGPFKPQGYDWVILDGFDYSKATVAACRAKGSKPIAYFSTHFEDWRPDSAKFRGKAGKIWKNKSRGTYWKGERYVDWKQNKDVYLGRILTAKAKGFVGIDWDNVDGPGSRGCIEWLLTETKKAGLLFGLKNTVEALPKYGNRCDFFVSEAYSQSEVSCYAKFAPKPVCWMHYPGRTARLPSNVFKASQSSKLNQF